MNRVTMPAIGGVGAPMRRRLEAAVCRAECTPSVCRAAARIDAKIEEERSERASAAQHLGVKCHRRWCAARSDDQARQLTRPCRRSVER
jgi:hypothetical protein